MLFNSDVVAAVNPNRGLRQWMATADVDKTSRFSVRPFAQLVHSGMPF
jgi:hypothetical protein